MGIRFHCPNGHKINVKSFMVGLRAKCPKCGTKVTVPSESEYESSRNAESELLAEENGAALNSGQPSTALDDLLPVDAATDAADIFADTNANWFVRPPDGNRYGPAKSEMMRAWIAEGRVPPDALVWRDGWEKWRPASEVFNDSTTVAAQPTQEEVVSVDTSGIPDFTAGILNGMAVLNREQANRVRIKRKQDQQYWLVFSGILLVLILILVIVLLFSMRNN